MKPYLVQPVGETEYAHLNKPVRYTPSFLTGLTNQKKKSSRDQHSGKLLSEVTGLYYQDGGLYCTFKDDIDMKNYGLSLILKDVKIKEYGDYIEPISATIESIDRVTNPRNHETFLYNSATVIDETNNNEGSDKVGDQAYADLNQQIGNLKTEVNNAKKDAKKAEELLQTKENEFNELKNKYDNIKTKFKGYEDKETNTIETIATNLAGDDNNLLEVYKDMSLDQLKVLQNKKQSEIDEEIKNKAKELSVDNEDLAKVYEKMSLEQLETIEKANEDWDKDLAEQFPNDTGFKGAGTGQRNGYNKDGAKKPPEKTDEEKQKEIDENFKKFKETV